MMKIFGFAGYSGSGKTTLIEQIVPQFAMQGLKVSLIKHAHHGFDIDHPGKDSYRHREAGCSEVLITSSQRWVLMHELSGEPEPGLQQQLKRISPCDLVLVEGFKKEPIPKLEIHRAAMGQPLLQPDDPYIVAIASDTPIKAGVPVLDLNDPERIAGFILRHLGIKLAAELKA
ncbi:MAG TPA: molybdopterin-guanine dinucleotide biosynthesis protein B [Burkholderiales bacterium]|nr:molybdopterin-guanine dinucleotide biosynthesis protein B [Burkholderiales bacterium]